MRSAASKLSPASLVDDRCIMSGNLRQAGRRPERSTFIGRKHHSPAAVSLLSLGLLLPFGAGAFPDRAIAFVTNAAASAPAKHVKFQDGRERQTVETRTTTVDGFLRERGITPQPGDYLSRADDAPLTDGSTLVYRPAVPVDLTIDDNGRQLRTAAATVGDVLAAQGLRPGPHDHVSPPLGTSIAADALIRVSHAASWLERVRTLIAPPVRERVDIGLTSGTRHVVDPGSPGVKETTIQVLQPNGLGKPRRVFLASHVVRFPRAKVIAEGVGNYSALATFARRGMAGTMRMADAALTVIATAYTAECSGCSGTTATGRPAGHGIVAVDPRYIPLGTHLYIPGYGRALAGDTGGAIHGNRIDLGFESNHDAMTFGRRAIVVYVVK